jgi:uncharacterized protein YqgV (UPF0045/DUF77 family)
MTKNTIHLGIQIVPLDQRENAYSIIDKAIEVIQNSGLKYVITPMETVIEGPYDLVNEISQKAQKTIMESTCEEFLVNIRMHIRKNGDVTMEEKRLDRN